MLIIYGVHRSRAFRNLWLSSELGVAYTQVPVIQAYRLKEPLAAGAPLNTASAEFLKINPNGHIPSIDDDGVILHESLAINLYLAKKHGGPLAPQGIREEGEMTMWGLWAVTEMEPYTLSNMKTYRDGLENTPDGKEALSDALDQLSRPFSVLDAHLAKTGALVGGRFSVADLNLVEVVRYASVETGLIEAHPHVNAWVGACHARPHFQRLWAERLAEPA